MIFVHYESIKLFHICVRDVVYLNRILDCVQQINEMWYGAHFLDYPIMHCGTEWEGLISFQAQS